MRKRRSWLITANEPANDLSRSSSHSMVGRSRWLVGSSSSRMSGSPTSAIASETRRISPPGKAHGRALGVHAELGQDHVGTVRAASPRSAGGRPVSTMSASVAALRQHGLLRQIGNGGARLREQLAAVELDQAGQDAQQGGLARAVAAHQADAVAAFQDQVESAKQLLLSDAQPGVLEGEEWRGHGRFGGTGRRVMPGHARSAPTWIAGRA